MSRRFAPRWTPESMLRHRRQQKLKALTFPAKVLGGAALIGIVIGVAPALSSRSVNGSTAVTTSYAEHLNDCSVTDGDTIRCGEERIRLLGIDAPELPGHCREGRDCAPGDPYVSTSSLGEAMTGDLTIDRIGQDHYGRTLARVAGAMGDLSCWQLEHARAIYKPQWDNGLRVARTCPGAAF